MADDAMEVTRKDGATGGRYELQVDSNLAEMTLFANQPAPDHHRPYGCSGRAPRTRDRRPSCRQGHRGCPRPRVQDRSALPLRGRPVPQASRVRRRPVQMSAPASAGSNPDAGPAGPIRLAMWSGPRNLSTALMRSFGNRPDCTVVDEPFYAAYLAISGAEHPMREEILRHHETDWRKVAEQLAADPPAEKPTAYQKHMTHHMLPEIGRDWMRTCRHAFLIRHPARVLASYAAKRESVELRDIGFQQQSELFDLAADLLGHAPPVVDADDLLDDPRRCLQGLCRSLGIPFREQMLSWPAGGRESDGIWAAHWYDAVNRSTGFERSKPVPALSDPSLREIEAEALPIYRKLARYTLA